MIHTSLHEACSYTKPLAQKNGLILKLTFISDNNLTLTMANGAKGSKVQPLSEIRKIETKNIVSSLKKVDLKYILALI